MSVLTEKQREPLPSAATRALLRARLPILLGKESPSNSLKRVIMAKGSEYYPQIALPTSLLIAMRVGTGDNILDDIYVGLGEPHKEGWQLRTRMSLVGKPDFEVRWSSPSSGEQTDKLTVHWRTLTHRLVVDLKEGSMGFSTRSLEPFPLQDVVTRQGELEAAQEGKEMRMWDITVDEGQNLLAMRIGPIHEGEHIPLILPLSLDANFDQHMGKIGIDPITLLQVPGAIIRPLHD